MSKKTYHTIAETAAYMDHTAATIRNWVNLGCPFVQQGDGKRQEWQFDLTEVIKWRVERFGAGSGMASFEEARTRKVLAEAEISEMNLAARRGEVVPIEEVAKQVGEKFSNVRAKLLAVPSKLAPLLATIDSTREITEILDTTFRELLEELSELDQQRLMGGVDRSTPGSTDPDDTGETETPAKAPRRRVGRPKPGPIV